MNDDALYDSFGQFSAYPSFEGTSPSKTGSLVRASAIELGCSAVDSRELMAVALTGDGCVTDDSGPR
jgi:hypothetical protein